MALANAPVCKLRAMVPLVWGGGGAPPAVVGHSNVSPKPRRWHVRPRGDWHQNSGRHWARRQPTRPSVPLCHTRLRGNASTTDASGGGGRSHCAPGPGDPPPPHHSPGDAVHRGTGGTATPRAPTAEGPEYWGHAAPTPTGHVTACPQTTGTAPPVRLLPSGHGHRAPVRLLPSGAGENAGRCPRAPLPNSPTHQTRSLGSGNMGLMGEVEGKWGGGRGGLGGTAHGMWVVEGCGGGCGWDGNGGTRGGKWGGNGTKNPVFTVPSFPFFRRSKVFPQFPL